MITGDSKETAVAIGLEVNILPSPPTSSSSPTSTNNNDIHIYNNMLNTHAFTTHEFFALPLDVQFNLLKSGNKVFCRAEPRGKQWWCRLGVER